jgi:hypothetical protein
MSLRGSLVTVLAAALVIWASRGSFHARPGLTAPSAARTPVLTRPAMPAPPPTARDILDHGALLHLKAEQRARLRALDARWTAESAAAEAGLRAATDEFARSMEQARAAGRTSLTDIQRQSAEIGELGAEMRDARRRHADAAAAILTEWQHGRFRDIGRVPARGE